MTKPSHDALVRENWLESMSFKMQDLQQVSGTVYFLPLSFPICELWVGSYLLVCVPVKFLSSGPQLTLFSGECLFANGRPFSQQVTTPQTYHCSGSNQQAMTDPCELKADHLSPGDVTLVSKSCTLEISTHSVGWDK